jgi:hypothetical protein
MAYPRYIYDLLNTSGFGVGYRTASDTWHIYDELNEAGLGIGYHSLEALYWYEKVQIQDDPPLYDEGWRRIYDFTPPTVAPMSPALDYTPLDDLTYPKYGIATWVAQSQPFQVTADFYRSTDHGTTYLVADSNGTTNDTDQSIQSPSGIYNGGDYGYCIIYYVSLDGNVVGPGAQSAVRSF